MTETPFDFEGAGFPKSKFCGIRKATDIFKDQYFTQKANEKPEMGINKKMIVDPRRIYRFTPDTEIAIYDEDEEHWWLLCPADDNAGLYDYGTKSALQLMVLCMDAKADAEGCNYSSFCEYCRYAEMMEKNRKRNRNRRIIKDLKNLFLGV